ncbi:MAG: hypothetical protein JSW67_06360 [Candidatus Latescibacterota bacterium]|nr:MAG: hypothetical protein JSW67_06360 [Candidatus Latescibacterota bacterium]
MNCRNARKHLQERHDDVPSSQKEAALQEHLSACAPCSRLAREMDLAFEWLRALPDAQPTESFDWRLRLRLSKLDQESQARLTLEPQPVRRTWTLQFAVSAALAAGVVLVAGLYMLRSGPESGPRLVKTPTQTAPLPVTPAQPPASFVQSPVQTPVQTPVQWPRPVPVRYGVPLGPQHQPLPAPSILGDPSAREGLVNTVPVDSIRELQWPPPPPAPPQR